MNNEPYANETWEELADHQLDHDPTPAQDRIKREYPKRIGLVFE